LPTAAGGRPLDVCFSQAQTTRCATVLSRRSRRGTSRRQPMPRDVVVPRAECAVIHDVGSTARPRPGRPDWQVGFEV
jgi:hypothetical protein